MNLDELRQKIDTIDSQLAQLLEERMRVVNQIADLKKAANTPTYDPSREEEIVNKAVAQIKETAFSYPIADTFRDIMKHSRDFQNKKREHTD